MFIEAPRWLQLRVRTCLGPSNGALTVWRHGRITVLLPDIIAIYHSYSRSFIFLSVKQKFIVSTSSKDAVTILHYTSIHIHNYPY
jgi:hypothetical protein